jgi:hypothetical protein
MVNPFLLPVWSLSGLSVKSTGYPRDWLVSDIPWLDIICHVKTSKIGCSTIVKEFIKSDSVAAVFPYGDGGLGSSSTLTILD